MDSKPSGPKPLCLSANGELDSHGWYEGRGEKCVLRAPPIAIKPARKASPEQNISKIRGILDALSLGKYDGSNGAGGESVSQLPLKDKGFSTFLRQNHRFSHGRKMGFRQPTGFDIRDAIDSGSE
jgi:hypothetical protein